MARPLDHLIIDFFEVPRSRSDELRKASRATKWGIALDRGRLESILETFMRPAPRYAEVDPYFLPTFAYLDEKGICENEPAAYADLLCDLVELHGGTWMVIEPTRELPARLDPDRFAESELAEFWEESYDESSADAPAGMLAALSRLRSVVAALDSGSFLLIRLS